MFRFQPIWHFEWINTRIHIGQCRNSQWVLKARCLLQLKNEAANLSPSNSAERNKLLRSSVWTPRVPDAASGHVDERQEKIPSLMICNKFTSMVELHELKFGFNQVQWQTLVGGVWLFKQFWVNIKTLLTIEQYKSELVVNPMWAKRSVWTEIKFSSVECLGPKHDWKFETL